MTPGSVELDPRSEETQEDLPRSAATSRPHEASTIVPQPLNPTVIVEDVPKTTEAPPEAGKDQPADTQTGKTDKNVQE